MNRIFKLVWSTAINGWCCVAETVCARGKASRAGVAGGGASATPWLAGLFFTIPVAALGAPPAATQLPTGGQVVAGQAQINASAPAQLTINQSSTRAAINWQSFDIGAAAQVTFKQPNAQSVTLNRVTGADPSQIFGRLTANGSVFLTNPNGVLFAPTARVDVGALVATTMGITNADFMAGKAVFSRNGSSASVENQGRIQAADYIALLAPEVRNEGVLVAQAGTIALAAGEAITLDFGPDSRLQSIAVTPAQIRTLVENRGAVIAEGGQIVLSARAAESLLGSVINSGSASASSIVDRGGVITIEADAITLADSSRLSADGSSGGRVQVGSMQTRQTQAGGTISARGTGASGGEGGFVETSAQQLSLGGVRVDTSGAAKTGQWLLDPYDLSVGSSDASTIATNLGTSNVTLQTSASGTSGPGTANAAGSGDISINSAISWSSANTLTLDAYRNININAAVTASGTGKVVMITGDTGGNQTSTGGDYSFGLSSSGFAGSLNFTGTPNAGQSLSINGNAYTLLYNMTSTANVGLGSLSGKTTGFYALANNITSAGTFNTAAPFGTFGSSSTHAGTFTGLGHTVDGLVMNAANYANVGAFGVINGTVRDVGITNASVSPATTANGAGILAGVTNGATIANVYTTGTLTSSQFNTGGVIGKMNSGSVDNAWSGATVNSTQQSAGGLIGAIVTTGSAGASVTNSHATGNVTNTGNNGYGNGGLIGSINLGGGTVLGTTVSNSYATGAISSAREYAGGLIGEIQGGTAASHNTISSSYATGAITTTNTSAGGLVGSAAGYTDFLDTYATGAISTTSSSAGGLIGVTGATAVTVTRSYATGSVTGTTTNATGIGGLIGDATATTISQSFASGDVTAYGYAGGLIGNIRSGSVLTDVYAAGNVSSNGSGAPVAMAGLIGYASGGSNTVTNAYASGTIPTPDVASGVAGVVGQGNNSISLTNVYWDSTTEGAAGYGNPAPTSVTGGGAKTTAQLQDGSYPNGFSSSIWAVVPGAFPYFQNVGTAPAQAANYQQVFGDATLTGGGSAAAAVINLYKSGSLLAATTTSSTGAFAFNLPLGSFTTTTPLGETMALSGAPTTPVGASYNDSRTSDQTSKFRLDIAQNVYDYYSSASTLSAMIAAPDVAFGSSLSSSLLTTLNSGDHSYKASGSLTVDTAPNANGALTLAAKGGDLTIATGFSTTAGKALNLEAYDSLHVNAPISATNTTAASIRYDTGNVGGDYDFGLSDSGFAGRLDLGTTAASASLSVNGASYSLIYALPTTAGGTALAAGNYALANSLTDVTARTAGIWTTGGNAITFTGLGHTISGLNQTTTTSNTGLFSTVTGSTLRDVGVPSGTITTSGSSSAGALVGTATRSTIKHVYAGATVSNANTNTSFGTGGLVGNAIDTSISDAFTTGTVRGTGSTAVNVGGIVGRVTTSTAGSYAITDVHSSATITNAGDNSGGLIGRVTGVANAPITISDAYATGSVSGTGGSSQNAGGLIGLIDGVGLTVTDVYATGNVSVNTHGGGLIGGATAASSGTLVSDAYATGNVSVATYGGGLIGYIQLGGQFDVVSTYATGDISGSSTTTGRLGGLIGYAAGASAGTMTVDQSYASGSVTSASTEVGGLIGYANNTVVTESFASGNVSGTSIVGGLVGHGINVTNFSDVYALGNVTATGAASGNTIAGGLVGQLEPNGSGSVSYVTNAYSAGTITASGTTNKTGGVVGMTGGPNLGVVVLTNAYWDATQDGQTTATGGSLGGTTRYASGTSIPTSTDNNSSATAGSMTTTALTSGALPTNFNTGATANGNPWNVAAGFYPYFTWQFPNGAMTISGTAYTGAGAAAGQATVRLYTGGALISGGQVRTDASAGTYAALVDAGTFANGYKLGGTLTVNGAGTISGASYTDSPTVVSGNITGFDLKSGVYLRSTAETSASALNTSLSGTFGSGTVAALTATNIGTLWQTNASGAFTLDSAMNPAVQLAFTASGDLTINAALSSTGVISLKSGGTISDGASGSISAGGGLALLGGNVVLDGAANAVSTVAGSGLGSAVLVSSSALAVGTISGVQQGVTATSINGSSGAVTGLSASGAVRLQSAGDLGINAALASSGGTATLQSGGTITDGASGSITATGLALTGGNATIDNAANSFGTLAASGMGTLSVTTAGALTVGTVGATGGVSASGTVAIATSNGDLTVAQNIATTNTGSSAITLNAGQARAAGTSTGGNIVISGSPAITTGAGGRATLYSGSATGDTSLATLIGSGSGHFRYNSDESTTNYTTALGTGLYGIYRQQLNTAVALGSDTMVYGNAMPSLVASSGLVNGDTASPAVQGAVTSSSGNLVVGSYTVTADLTALTGLGYTSSGNTSGTLTVTPRTLSVSGVTASDRAYDGTTAATLNAGGASFSGAIGGDDVSLGGGSTGTFDDKNVGTGKTVTVSYSLGGVDAGNYTAASGSAVTASITPKIVSVSGIVADNKVYDGTTAATLSNNGTVATGVGSETLALSHGDAFFADKNVGAGKTVTVIDYVLGNGSNGGMASNYQLASTSATTTADIGTKTLTVTANHDAKLVTQADTAGYNGASYNGFVGGDTAASLGGALVVTRAGQGTDEAAGTYTNALVASGLSSGNYAISYVSGSFTVVPADTLLIKAGNQSVVYGTGLTYSGVTAQYITGANVIHTLTQTGGSGSTYVFSDGIGGTATVTLAPQSATTSAGGFLNVGSYTIADAAPQSTGSNFTSFHFVGNADVTQKGVSVTPGPVSKVYDGTTNMTGVTLNLAGALSGDQLGVSGSGNFAQKNVGTNLAYTIDGIALSQADAGNYYLSGGTSLSGSDGSITPRALTISGITASDKVYDQGTAATVNVGAAVFTGLVAGDAVTVSATGTFADKNVGSGKTVTLVSSNGGADLGNYTVTNQAGTTASITPKALTVTGITAADRDYNGTTAASVSTAGIQYAGLIGGDSLAIVSSTGSFANRHAGAGKTVSLVNTYGGADLGNYTLTDQASTTASIAAAALTVSAANLTKTYDGGTSAAGATAVVTSGTLFAGDTLSGGSFAFADKNAGIGNKTVTVSGISVNDGNGGGDYLLTLQDNTTSTINKAALSVTGFTAAGKTYDGTTSATVSGAGAVFGGLIGSDDVTLNSATGSFADKNAGTAKTVLLNASYAGADAGNYTITTQASTTADIAKASLSISGITAADKVYDGGTTAIVDTSGAVYTGLIGSDVVTVGATGLFGDKNVQNNKTVTLTSSYGGADAGNYTITDQASTTASITPRALTIGGITAADRTYDGTTAATVSTAGATRSGLVGGDDVTISASGSFTDKNAGSGKTVNLSSSYGGADAGNYTITDQATTTASIGAATLVLTAASFTKTYDQTTGASGATATVSGGTLFGGDSLSGGSFAFTDKNFGIGNKTLTVSGVTVNDGNGGANYAVSYANNTSSTINKASLTISGITAADKVYDGTVNATVSTAGAVYTGLFSGDAVTVSATGTFADANAGASKTVNLSSSYSGADLANYAITGQTTALATIFQKALVVTANDDARFVTQSDGANFNGVHYSGFVGGDTATSLNTSGLTVTRPNAGTDVAAGVYAGALVPAGVTAANYTITFANGSYTILAANNALVKTVNVDVGYGTTPSYTVASVQYMDAGNVIGNLTQISHSGSSYVYSDGAGGTLSFTLAPAGATTSSSGRVNVGNYAISDAAPVIGGGNLAGAVTFVGNQAVQQAAVGVAAGGVSKVYDGTTSMTGITLNLSGQFAGDALNISGTGAFAQKNVGSNLSYSVSNLTLGGADAGNYYVTGGGSLSGSDGSITPRLLAVTGISAADKTYDGSTSATVNSSGVSFGGLVGGDDVHLSASSGQFDSKNAGTNKTVNLNNSYAGADLGNYTVVDQTTTTATITPLALTLGGLPDVGHLTKTYDGTTVVAVDTGGVTFGGLLPGDTLGISASGTTADKNVGTNLPVSIVSLLTGTDAGNYSFSGFPTTGSVTVSPKLLTISGITAADRAYDQTVNATISLAGIVYAGLVGGDQLTTSTSGVFSDSHAGVGKTVTLTSTHGGADLANYTITDQATTTATITPLALTVTGTPPDTSGLTKVYDGTTNVPIDTSGLTIGGLLPGDQVSITATGTTTDKNVGTDKPVDITGGLSGPNAGDYVYVFPVGSGLVTITPKALLIGGITAADKVYDGTTAATLGLANVSFTGAVAGDTVGYATNGRFADRNVGTAKTVDLGLGLTGADAANYTLTGQTTTTASITPKVITIELPGQGTPGGVDLSKTYDGTTNVPIDTSGVTIEGLLPGDSLVYTATGTTADKNVGVDKTVTIVGGLSGPDAGNYAIQVPTLTGVVTVTPMAIVVSGITADNKVYDGTTAATVNTGNATLAGLFAGDQVLLTATGAFVDKNAGTGKTVNLVSSYGGADAGNYSFTSQATTTASITPRTISVDNLPGSGGNTDYTKTYDGTTNVPIDTSGVTIGGLLPGDSVGYGATGTTPDKNAGIDKVVTIVGGLTGPDAGNYQIVGPTVTTGSVDVLPRAIGVIGTVVLPKVADGTTTVGLTGSMLDGSELLPGDLLTLTNATTGQFTDASPGTGKPVTTNMGLSGADAGNYVIQQPQGLTGTVTQQDVIVLPPAPPPPPLPPPPPPAPPAPAPVVQPPGGGTITPPPGPGDGGGTPTGPVVDPGAGAGSGGQPGDNTPPVASLQLLASPTEAAAAGGGFVSVLNFEPMQVFAGTQLGVALPLNTFTHSDPAAQITYEARLSNGTPLPAWLSFDGTNLRFTGTPPPGAGDVDVVIVARDKNGKEARTRVTIQVSKR